LGLRQKEPLNTKLNGDKMMGVGLNYPITGNKFKLPLWLCLGLRQKEPLNTKLNGDKMMGVGLNYPITGNKF
ncbi:hypothetical protein CUC61_20235, partial [Acinetobacter baumannii]